MLYAEVFELPWVLFIGCLIMFAAVLSFTTSHVIRWWQRRRVTLVDLPPVDDTEADVTQERVGRVWQSDPSDEDVVFVRFRDSTTQVDITMRGMSVQTSTWESYSTDEVENEIAFRLSTPYFSMITHVSIPLRQDHSRRVQYKAAGATYNGTSQTWSMRPGRDLRNGFYHDARVD